MEAVVKTGHLFMGWFSRPWKRAYWMLVKCWSTFTLRIAIVPKDL